MAAHRCPCGKAGDPGATCQCSAADIERYRARLSGPLADRIDLHVHVGAVHVAALGAPPGEERSTDVRARVTAARDRQRERYAKLPGVHTNAEVPGRWLIARDGITVEARAALEAAARTLDITARTIADLDGEAQVGESAVLEALRYRAGE